MTRSIAGLIIIMSVAGAGRASAQETSPGPGKLEVTAIPAGAVYFTRKDSLPSFGNYGLGGSLTYNFNRFVGVEGEGGAEIAVRDLQFGDLSSSTKVPNMLGYNIGFSHSTCTPALAARIVYSACRKLGKAM